MTYTKGSQRQNSRVSRSDIQVKIHRRMVIPVEMEIHKIPIYYNEKAVDAVSVRD